MGIHFSHSATAVATDAEALAAAGFASSGCKCTVRSSTKIFSKIKQIDGQMTQTRHQSDQQLTRLANTLTWGHCGAGATGVFHG